MGLAFGLGEESARKTAGKSEGVPGFLSAIVLAPDDRVGVDRQHPDAINEVGERAQLTLAAAHIQRAVASLGDRWRSYGDTPADRVLGVLRLAHTLLHAVRFRSSPLVIGLQTLPVT
jgi:hypothetical protein